MEEKRRTLRGVKGSYEILLPLARDRLADYHLGLNQQAQGDDRFVRIREILPELSGERDRVSAFLSELRVVSRFNHPNLLRTLETGRTKVSYFAIEEFLLGEGLGRVLAAAQAASVALPPALAAGALAQACDGLEFAHQLRDAKGNPLAALHRNVSPMNLVVCYSGRVKLLDFDVNETAFQLVDGQTRGDLAYLAPEQVERAPLGPQSDVFSAGVVLWELLAGQALFRRASALETRRAVLAARVPAIAPERRVPGELTAVVERALQRNPRSRFQTAGQMGQALRDFLRQAGAEVGEYEIGSFVRGLLGDVERRKRRLLDQSIQGALASGDITSLQADRKTPLEWGPAVGGGAGRAVSSPDHTRARASQEVPRLPPVPPRPVTPPPIPFQASPDDAGGQAGKVRSEAEETDLDKIEVDKAEREKVEREKVEREKTEKEKAEKEKAEKEKAEKEKAERGKAAREEAEGEMAGKEPAVPPAPAPRRSWLLLGAGLALLGLAALVVAYLALGGDDGRTGQKDEETAAQARPEDRAQPEAPPAEAPPVADAGVAAGDPGPASAAAVGPPRPDLAPSETRPKTPPAPAKGSGYLQVNTVPWTEVWLGTRKLGVTPLLGAKLPVGKHKIRLVNPGAKIAVTVEVTIQAHKTTSIAKQLQ